MYVVAQPPATAYKHSVLLRRRHVQTPFLGFLALNTAQKAMIRRPPTLIRMSDLDVQDVRDLVAAQKRDSDTRNAFVSKIAQTYQGPPPGPERDKELLEHFQAASAWQAAKEDRERRLGLSNDNEASTSRT